MKKKMKKTVEILKSTTMIGLVTTGILTYFVYSYYDENADLKIQESGHGKIYNALEFIDHKSIDARFNVRGYQPTSEKIAVLAVDDASLDQIGRWPWSREKIADLIDRLMREGAKTLGFDMVFSEPQEERALQILQTIEKTEELSPALKNAFASAKTLAQPDQILAATLNKYREKLVLGAFFDYIDVPLEPYQDICYNEAFKRTEGYSIRTNEELPPFVFNEVYSPSKIHGPKDGYIFENTPFDQALNPIFEKIENEVSTRLLKDTFEKKSLNDLTRMELSQVALAKEKALRYYCSTWFERKNDRYYSWWQEQWPKLFANHPILANTKLDDEVDKIASYILTNPLVQTGRWTVNIPELRNASAHNAMFSAIQDDDGTFRRTPFFYRAGYKQDSVIPSLAMQTYLVATGYQAHLTLDQDKSVFLGQPNASQFSVSKLEITDPETDEVKVTVPVDSRGRLQINYAGPHMSYPHLSAAELFHDRPQIKITQYLRDATTNRMEIKELSVDRKEFIKDRIFILGVTAVGVYDMRVTPFEEKYAGVETHVSALANLMSKNFLKPIKNESRIMILAMIGTGFFTTLLVHFLGAFAGLFSMILLLSGILVSDQYFLFNRGYLTSAVFPALEVLFIYIAMTGHKYWTEERNKRKLRATFSKYVSPAIVDEILSDPENIKLGGHKERMTVFFSDIRGFTTISEKLEPEVLSSVLNEYLTPMTNIVFENKGTLDKYMGDAVMAFFGAPIFFPDHAKYACRCALQSMEKLKEIQLNFEQRGLPKIDIGIGINTSDMSVGNMGSEIVRSFTVMGDGVNLGSRLEGINKEYGTHIIISEFTYGDVKNEFTCREVDWVRVKGKLQPIKIYELICEGPSSPDTQRLLDAFNRGYALYREMKFTEALEAFEQARAVNSTDPVTQLYIERCTDYIAEPPPEHWNGVFVMKTK